MAGNDDTSQGILGSGAINQKAISKPQQETASSWDAGSYNDGDDNTGNVLRRTKPNIPLQQTPPGFSEDNRGRRHFGYILAAGNYSGIVPDFPSAIFTDTYFLCK